MSRRTEWIVSIVVIGALLVGVITVFGDRIVSWTKARNTPTPVWQ